MSIALESRYFHGGPHRPPHIVVRDQQNRVFSVNWEFNSHLTEKEQHQHTVVRALTSLESPLYAHYSGIYSARWKSGWRHIAVQSCESAE